MSILQWRAEKRPPAHFFVARCNTMHYSSDMTKRQTGSDGQLSVRLPQDTLAELDELSAAMGETRSVVLRLALRRGLRALREVADGGFHDPT